MLHQELLEHFYHSFKHKDVEGMISCYHNDVEFSDPAFGLLKGDEARNMWRMLLERNNSLTLDYNNVSADATSGKANWTAEYVFSRTNRKVVNEVSAQFEFKDGKIIRHTDTFDLKKWGKQALGTIGTILGFTGQLKPVVQKQAREALSTYMKERQAK
ncbi:MAG: nuclear transport factor 2 family protein [Cytophagales bacterium]|nr:nuclear transport factor 2 family protein [Cytophaga sp.]